MTSSERHSEDIPVLVGYEGQLNGQRWLLQGSLLIGRDISCDVSIPNRQVSRNHARVSLTPDGILVEDLNSKNGTHCNGELIADPKFLGDGDVIQIALAQKFIFLSADSTLPLEIEDIDPTELSMGRLRLEKLSRRVWIGDREVIPPLSVSQFRLLEIIYKHHGRVVPRRDLIIEVWGEENAIGVSEQALDALVRRLRDRLASIDPSHQYVATVRGHGLRLDNPPVTNA
jgi:DNA-binding winged helix-turn-helix (wHTH) protein